jgi:hypothetical protein
MLPLASVLAAVVGVFLMFGRNLKVAGRNIARRFAHLTGRK